jgi:hypothetical protein
MASMSNRTYFMVGKYTIFVSKNDIPAHLMLVFSPNDKEITGKGVDTTFCYATTIAKARQRLDDLGLTNTNLSKAIQGLGVIPKDIPIILDNFLKEKTNMKAFLTNIDIYAHDKKDVEKIPKNIDEFIWRLFNTNHFERYSQIIELWMFRLLCTYMEDQIQVILDPFEVVYNCDPDYWGVPKIKELDLHKILLNQFANELLTYNELFNILLFPWEDSELISLLHSFKEDELIDYVIVP